MSNLVSAFANIIGASMASRDSSQNRKAQYDFAQRGLQWKVADAKKAGLHPLAAINATGAFYSPVHSDAASFARDAGQDLSRALASHMSARERRTAEHAAVVRQQIDDDIALRESNARIENTNAETELLRSQIARMNSAQVGPGVPDAAPGSVNVLPSEVVTGDVGAPERAPGMVTDYQFGRTASGGYTIMQSQDFHNRTEDTPQDWGWQFRNGLIPHSNIFADLQRQHPAAPGHRWQWNPFTQEFTQVRSHRAPRSRDFGAPRGRDY